MWKRLGGGNKCGGFLGAVLRRLASRPYSHGCFQCFGPCTRSRLKHYFSISPKIGGLNSGRPMSFIASETPHVRESYLSGFVVKFAKESFLVFQFLGSTRLNDFSVMKHQDVFAKLGLPNDIVVDEHRRSARTRLLHNVNQWILLERPHPGRRFIQEEDFWIAQQTSRQRKELALTT